MKSDLFYCKITLHVSGVQRTHHQEYWKRGQVGNGPDLATLEGSSCTDIMTCTGGYGYSFQYS